MPDLSAWGILPPSSVRRPEHGTNNLVWIIDDAYVLRIYQNHGSARVAAELRLLKALDGGNAVPFAVPTPIPTADGQLYVQTDSGPAALFHYLAGRSARRSDLGELHRVGAALATLDLALADVPNELAPHDWRRSLDAVHPAVPSVADLCQELSAHLPGDAGVRRLRDAAVQVDEVYASLTQELPVQIVHGDLGLSNVLIGSDGAVVGVLDFEIAGMDLRAADLAAGLSMAVEWGSAHEQAQVAAFRRGYSTVMTLEPSEKQAIPQLMRRRALGSVIWRAGRWRQGLATLDEVRARLTEFDAG